MLQGRKGLGNIYVWASGDGGEEDDCNCDGYAASMWTISINSAINDGQNAHYDESCSSTLASTFSNGAKDPNTGVVSSYITYVTSPLYTHMYLPFTTKLCLRWVDSVIYSLRHYAITLLRFFSLKATTDLYGKCTTTHSGTSAAAPEAAGVFALALEAK